MVTVSMNHGSYDNDGKMVYDLELIKHQRINHVVLILKEDSIEEPIEVLVPFGKLVDFVKSANKIHIPV
jgi:hypothetical protein